MNFLLMACTTFESLETVRGVNKGSCPFMELSVLISVIIGEVFDIKVKSRYCFACSVIELKKGTKKYNDWLPRRVAHCDKNYSGSSGSMETHSVVDMCRRSVQLHDVRYEHILR